MSAYFNQVSLDMIALESAIGAYEVETGITEDLLDRSYDDGYGYATESAYIEDDFGFGIFDDVESGRATEGIGSAIGGGIKKILGAIAGFFKKVGEGIAAFFASFKKKKAEVGNKEVKLTPEAAKVANNIRAAIKTAIGIVGNISKSDSEYIKQVIGLINNAIKNAKVNEQQIKASYMQGASSKQVNEREKKLDAMATNFRNSSTDEGAGTDEEKDAAANEMLTKCEGYLTKVKATQEQLTSAVAKVQEIFQDEVNKLNLRDDSKAEFDTGAPKAAVQHSKDEDDDGARKAYNERAKSRSSVGFQTAKDKKDLAVKSITNQIRQYIFVTFDFASIEKVCNEVKTACSTNAKMCQQIADSTPEGSRNGTAYRMCRILSDASNIYTAITSAIEKLTSGSIFKATKDGTTIDEKVTIHDYDSDSFKNVSTSVKDE